MAKNSLHGAYDANADTLYLSFNSTAPAVSREEDAPGLYWRYALDDGSLIGVTILDFDAHWSGQRAELLDELVSKLQVSRKQAQCVLDSVH